MACAFIDKSIKAHVTCLLTKVLPSLVQGSINHEVYIWPY